MCRRGAPSSGMLGPVRRLLTTSLLLLALAGILSGNLLRPCDCGSGDGGDARALCPSQLPTHTPRPSCCACANARPDEGPGGSDRPDDEEGCPLCCKPRPPLAEAAHAVELADAHVVVDAVVAELASVAVPARRHSSALSHERRTGDHWLLSPEGLAVFLI